MSQERLGESISLPLNQVEKFELGTSRLGASRLFDLSRALDVPVKFFYDDTAQDASTAGKGTAVGARQPGWAENQDSFPAVASVNGREPLELIQAFYQVTDPVVRKQVLDLIKSMGTGKPES